MQLRKFPSSISALDFNNTDRGRSGAKPRGSFSRSKNPPADLWGCDWSVLNIFFHWKVENKPTDPKKCCVAPGPPRKRIPPKRAPGQIGVPPRKKKQTLKQFQRRQPGGNRSPSERKKHEPPSEVVWLSRQPITLHAPPHARVLYLATALCGAQHRMGEASRVGYGLMPSSAHGPVSQSG